MFKPSPILQAYTLLTKEAQQSPQAAKAAEALRNEAAKECLEAYVSGALQNESAQTEERREIVFEINDQQTVKFFLDRLQPGSTNHSPVPLPPPVPTPEETIQRMARPNVRPLAQPDFEPPPVKLPRLAFDSSGAVVPAQDLAKKTESYSSDSESKSEQDPPKSEQKPVLTPENETAVVKGETQAEAKQGKPKEKIPLRYESLPVLVNRKEFARAIKAKAKQKGIPQVTLIKSMGFTPGGLANLLKATGSAESKWGAYLAEVLGSQILA